MAQPKSLLQRHKRAPDWEVSEAGVEGRERHHTLPAQSVLPKPGWQWPAEAVALGQRVAGAGLQRWV